MNTAIKHTEIGSTPGDWEIMTFGTLFAFTNGLNADKAAYGKGIPFINVLEPITYSHIYGPEITGRVQIFGESAMAFLVKTNDIVLNRTSETDSELGLAAVYLGDKQVVFGGFVIRGRPISDALDPNYSGYALRAKTIRTQIVSMGQGAVRANIGQQNLKRVLVAVPPKHEQQAIAKALGDIDALIAGLDRLIAKKRGIKQATMQQLLTGKTRLPGFSGKWEVKQLGEVLTICHGKNQQEVTVVDGPYPILASGGQIGTASRPLYDKPTVLIGRKGTIDRPQYMESPFWTVDTLFYSAMKDGEPREVLLLPILANRLDAV